MGGISFKYLLLFLSLILLSACGSTSSNSEQDTASTFGQSTGHHLLYMYSTTINLFAEGIGEQKVSEVDLSSQRNLGYGNRVMTQITDVSGKKDTYMIHIMKLLPNQTVQAVKSIEMALTSHQILFGRVQPSPDSTKLAISIRENVSLGTPFENHVYITDMNGKTLFAINTYEVSDPYWISNDEFVVANEANIYRVSISKSLAQRIGPDGLGRPGYPVKTPALSPDGKSLAFLQNGEVWRIDLDGSRLQQVTLAEVDPAYPAWSTDGTKITLGVGICSSIVHPFVVNVDANKTMQKTGAGSENSDSVSRANGTPLSACGPYYWID